MDLTVDQWTQLIVGLTVAVVFFVFAYVAPPRVTVSLLIVLAPFQILASRFGSLNVGLIYLVGAAHFLRGRIRAWPLLTLFALILLIYFLSMSQTLRATYVDHAIYIFGIGADMVFFYVVYNHARQSTDVRPLLRLFLYMNALILLYCVIQMFTGYQRFAFLGVQEFEFGANLEAKQRLIGPFGSAGTNGEVLVLQILLMCYLLLYQRGQLGRYILFAMLVGDFAFLVMTGSRGSFLTLVGSGFLFLWFFRHQVGFRRTMRIAAVALTCCAIVSVIVVSYSQFNVLYARLEGTTLDEGIPDTRIKAFNMALEQIPEHILLGHGPQLRLIEESTRTIPGYTYLYYPHNLYLFLVLTIGVLGFLAYIALFWSLYSSWKRARRRQRGDPFYDGLPTLAILLLIAFLVDQLKIEFLRSQYSDHQQYMFALWAILLAATAAPGPSKSTSVPPVPLRRTSP